jgi:hypothetical protein
MLTGELASGAKDLEPINLINAFIADEVLRADSRDLLRP